MNKCIDSLSPGEALRMLPEYERVHRRDYGCAPDPVFIHAIVSRAFEARIRGDRGVDVYELFRSIERGLSFSFDLYKGRLLTWKSLMLKKWHDQFRTGSYREPSPQKYSAKADAPTDYDIVSRVTLLLADDLWAFEQRQDLYKQKLLDNHRHYLSATLSDSASPLSAPSYDPLTLGAIRDFAKVAHLRQ